MTIKKAAQTTAENYGSLKKHVYGADSSLSVLWSMGIYVGKMDSNFLPDNTLVRCHAVVYLSFQNKSVRGVRFPIAFGQKLKRPGARTNRSAANVTVGIVALLNHRTI
jgi:hypothetical protein